mgnify:FL=1
MAKTTTSCPRCRQPVVADVEQLFDLNQDPRAKQRLLGGQANQIACQSCGYQGNFSTPIVYHDPDKELLLTFFPPEMGLPANEQERIIGPLITQVTNKLPAEKRKAYLFRPQTMFTFDTLIEKILEGDGITKEMIQAQQARLALLQRLLTTASAESRLTIIQQEEANIDAEFFTLFGRVIESAMAQGDQQTARALAGLQQELLDNTSFGRQVKSSAEASERMVKSLQEASQSGLTRDKLLDVFLTAPDEASLSTVVTMTRSGLDYEFFQILSDRIEAADGPEKEKLETLRGTLLKMVEAIDQQVAQQMEATKAILDQILATPDIEKTIRDNAQLIDDFFVEVVQAELQAARQNGDLARSAKLNQVVDVLKKLSAPPKEFELIEKLMQVEDDAQRRKILEENAEMVTGEFVQMLSTLASQSESQGQPPEVVEELKKIYRLSLRFTMEANLKK